MGQNHSEPGDIVIKKYMADASPDEQAQAREALNKVVQAHIKVIARMIGEGRGPFLKAEARR